MKIVFSPIGRATLIYAVLHSTRAKLALLQAAPLLRFVPAFLLGQGAGSAVMLPRYVLLLVLCGCLLLLFKRCMRYALPGFLSTFPLYQAQVDFPAREVRLLFEVVDQPDYRRNEQVTFTGRVLQIDGQEYVALAGRKLRCSSPLLPWRNSAHITAGAVLIVTGRIRQLPQSFNPFSFDSLLFRRGVTGFCKVRYMTQPLNATSLPPPTAQSRVVAAVRSWLGDSEATSIMLTMTVGLKGALSLRTERAFARLGLSHILVVSGYHFSVLVAGLVSVVALIVRLAPLTRRFVLQRYLLLLLPGGLCFYCLFIGGTQSASRALVALVAAGIGRYLERGVSFFNCILFALLVVSALWPGAIFELGPQYTFAALFGIGVALAGQQHSRQLFWRVPLYATFATSIVTACWFQTFSIWPAVVNCTLAPLFALLICKGGIVALALAWCCEPIGVPLLQVIHGMAQHGRNLIWYLADLAGDSWRLEPLQLGVLLLLVLYIAARVTGSCLQQFLLWRGVFPYRSLYAMQRTRIDL